MADPQALTLAFLADHPAEAARVVETVAGADAAALFAQIPARIGAPVLAAMLPTAAGRVLNALTDEQVLALLTTAGTQTAVALLRHIADPRRTRLIAGLPTVSALASRVLLGFPEDAVGAWCDPEVIALAPGTRTTDALHRIREGQETGIEKILVVDAERKLLGEVALETLLHAPDAVTVATLMRPTIMSLAAMMPISAATKLRAWEQTSMLPVVDREDRLIGVLRRTALSQALREHARQTQVGATGSMTAMIASGYWSVISGLAGATLTLLPTTKRVLPEDQ
jgi:magnesium transporter